MSLPKDAKNWSKSRIDIFHALTEQKNTLNKDEFVELMYSLHQGCLNEAVRNTCISEMNQEIKVDKMRERLRAKLAARKSK